MDIHTFKEVKDIVTQGGLSPDDIVIIHKGNSDDHRDAEKCWCNPLVISGKEFIESSFDC